MVYHSRSTLPNKPQRTNRLRAMAQYKHDRFFKFYIRSLYQTKGETQQNIQVRNDEDLEIDLMFIGDRSNLGWQQEDLGRSKIL
jgi:hypothetical protein